MMQHSQSSTRVLFDLGWRRGYIREDQALPLRGSFPLVPRAASPPGCSLLPLHQHVVLSVVKYGGRVQPRFPLDPNVGVNVKSRLIKLVLLPLWYGNKDIIRDTLS